MHHIKKSIDFIHWLIGGAANVSSFLAGIQLSVTRRGGRSKMLDFA